ncbi:hypothetical protein U1Q18_008453 [Sarracenia purpurea var. burkii]
MGNGVGKLNLCFAGDAGKISRRHDIAVYFSDPLDEGLGHSFCYFRPDPFHFSSETTTKSAAAAMKTTFKSISGASLSANTSTPLSTVPIDVSPYNTDSLDKASSFESSNSFAAIPLQPIPRNLIPAVRSGPIPRCSGGGLGSGPIERGFLSGPIERSFVSENPLENHYDHLQRYKPSSKKWGLIRNLKKAITNSIVVPIRGVAPAKGSDWTIINGLEKKKENGVVDSDCSDELFENSNVQWAQGKAGEDRVHIVVSEEHGWVFVGIYDGFNGPDATDYLLNNLYSNVHKELKGLLWNDKSESTNSEKELMSQNDEGEKLDCDWPRKRRRKTKNGTKGAATAAEKWEENQQRWKCEWERDRLELDRILNEKSGNPVAAAAAEGGGFDHSEVLKALSEGLRKTEDSYLEICDLMLMENPELSMMGSCVLGMLMKGEDVYLMNVGDSRAVLARKSEPGFGIGKAGQDLGRINEEIPEFEGDDFGNLPNLTSLQLTTDHSTAVEEEVKRIKKEHKDDVCAITSDRVKGSLKVTRAFGAGFLKQPKWNKALLEMFKIDYVGSSPYISCSPSLRHHRLTPTDRFLILSSDGLYQYFTNDEAVAEVEMFISSFPEGDPAQHLVEEVLFRAAKRAGMDFHELLDIPQGDRRRYHDDVSIIIISFEGRIWRSSI